ncbi:MAG: hypothetical protein ACI4EI_05460 [Muricoprocola sp.]
MATKSIVKNINITDSEKANILINAFDSSEKIQYREAELSRECVELKGNDIKEFFEK